MKRSSLLRNAPARSAPGCSVRTRTWCAALALEVSVCKSITQRPGVLHKDILSQSEVLIALRMTGTRDIAAIDAWARLHAEDEQAREVRANLAALPVGAAWCGLPVGSSCCGASSSGPAGCSIRPPPHVPESGSPHRPDSRRSTSTGCGPAWPPAVALRPTLRLGPPPNSPGCAPSYGWRWTGHPGSSTSRCSRRGWRSYSASQCISCTRSGAPPR